MAEVFHVYTCPVCENWSVEDHFHTSKDELEDVMAEHIYACFGITELLNDAPLITGEES